MTRTNNHGREHDWYYTGTNLNTCITSRTINNKQLNRRFIIRDPARYTVINMAFIHNDTRNTTSLLCASHSFNFNFIRKRWRTRSNSSSLIRPQPGCVADQTGKSTNIHLYLNHISEHTANKQVICERYRTQCTNLVVPATGDTIAAGLLARIFSNEDFPISRSAH